MPRIPTHTPDWTDHKPSDPGHTLSGLHKGFNKGLGLTGKAGGTVVDVVSLDFGRGGRFPKPLVVDVPRGALRLGQRLNALTLRDAKGRSVHIELTHVLQQRASPRRTASGETTETLTLNYERIRWNY